MTARVFVNGRFLRASEARISIFDRGFLYGEGFFETLRAYRGRVFRLDDHIERLQTSVRLIGLPLPRNRYRIEGAIGQLLQLNRLSNARVRIIVSRGPDPGPRKKAPSANLFITGSRLPSPARIQKTGVAVRESTIRRNPNSPLPLLKTQNYLESIMAREEARRRGAYEAIFLDGRGNIAEGAMSNIFLVIQRTLITPSLRGPLLPGITRKVVIELAKALGIPVRERIVKPRELREAREVFLTNSLVEVLPVTRIGAEKVGSGRPGPVTRTLQKSYREKVLRTLFPQR